MNISVALCTHEGSRFVVRQAESILRQTRVPDEVVLSDDASSDRTVELVESVFSAHTDIRLRVLRNERPLGVVENFQQAVLATSGDIVFLSDQDDQWRPTKIERMLAEFDRKPELLLLHTDALLVDEQGASLGLTLFDSLEASNEEITGLESGRAFSVLLRRNLALGASMAFRRELLDVAIPFGDAWVHDEWLAIVGASQGTGAVGVLREQLLDYRQHSNNQIGAQKRSGLAKLARLREPRRERNERLRRASDQLLNRLVGSSVADFVLAEVQRKVAHEHVRSEYPASRRRRIRPIANELRTGRYAASGRGWAGALADLLQPAE